MFGGYNSYLAGFKTIMFFMVLGSKGSFPYPKMLVLSIMHNLIYIYIKPVCSSKQCCSEPKIDLHVRAVVKTVEAHIFF